MLLWNFKWLKVHNTKYFAPVYSFAEVLLRAHVINMHCNLSMSPGHSCAIYLLECPSYYVMIHEVVKAFELRCNVEKGFAWRVYFKKWNLDSKPNCSSDFVNCGNVIRITPGCTITNTGSVSSGLIFSQASPLFCSGKHLGTRGDEQTNNLETHSWNTLFRM